MLANIPLFMTVDMNEMTMGDIRNMGAEHIEGVCTRGAEPNAGHAVYVHLIRSVHDVTTSTILGFGSSMDDLRMSLMGVTLRMPKPVGHHHREF